MVPASWGCGEPSCGEWRGAQEEGSAEGGVRSPPPPRASCPEHTAWNKHAFSKRSTGERKGYSLYTEMLHFRGCFLKH